MKVLKDNRSHKLRQAVLTAAVVLSSLFGTLTPAWSESSAVIFMYHRFGEADYPSTSITLQQFDAHLEELKTGGYTVMALPEIVKALKNGDGLPDKAVALTVDDAFLSVYEEAWPRLKKAGFPLTLFISTDPVDKGIRGYMNWDKIREMQAGGATIGGHAATHLHMPHASLQENKRELDLSRSRIMKELGVRPDLFAYPYGETSERLIQLVRSSGYIAAFGQHSGAAGRTPDLYYLPRFSLNEKYGDLSRFRLAANSRALHVEDLIPSDPMIGKGDDNPPALGFTIVGDPGLMKRLDRLACFGSHEGKLEVMRLGGDGGQARIEVRMNEPLPNGRTRLNCTLPANQNRWYWFGRQFFTKQ